MHITYDLPVAIEDILEAKKDWRGRYIKRECLALTILVNVAKAKYFSSLKICSVRGHLKFVALLTNLAR